MNAMPCEARRRRPRKASRKAGLFNQEIAMELKPTRVTTRRCAELPAFKEMK
jgi:hypothetical protein